MPSGSVLTIPTPIKALQFLWIFLWVLVTISTVESNPIIGNDAEKNLRRKLITESIDENSPEAPKLAWLASFPTSGDYDIISLIQLSANVATASNYGHLMQNEYGRYTRSMFASVPVYSLRSNGPFLFTHHLPMPPSQSFMPVLTNCGVYCANCFPGHYIMKRDQFIAKCASTIRFTPDISLLGPTGWGIYEQLHYDTHMIEKTILVIRDPFQVIYDRFIYLSFSYEKLNHRDHEWHTKYMINSKGFESYCSTAEVKFADEEQKWFHEEDRLKMLLGIPCHAEFFRWVQWYNLMFQTLEYLEMPFEIIYYEDLETKYNETFSKVLNFYNLQLNASAALPKFYPKVKHRFLSSENEELVKNTIKYFATNITLGHVQHYLF